MSASSPTSRPRRAPRAALRFILADNVARLRKARGWTQQQVATASGLTKSFISKIEAASLNVSIASLEALTVGFECWVVDLLTPIHRPAPPEIPRAPGVPLGDDTSKP